jgi:hypothetical protein
VLRPGGQLILSTPNRLTFSPGWVPGTPPLNPFHSRELSSSELAGLVQSPLRIHRLLGLRHGPDLTRLDDRHGGLVAAQLARPVESWPVGLLSDVAAVRADDFPATDTELDTALDLLLVAARE